MRITLEDILKRVGGYVDQDATVPTGTDLTNRISYANRALDDWGDIYDWEALTLKHSFTISEVSTASLSLPTNFKKPMSGLFVYPDGGSKPDEYELVRRNEAITKTASDKFAYLTGDIAAGLTLIVPKGLSSGASVFINYKMQPSSYATLSDVAQIQDPEYIVKRIISLVLESRGDERFPIVKAEADRTLGNMVEAQNAGNLGMNNQIPMPKGFRIGED